MVCNVLVGLLISLLSAVALLTFPLVGFGFIIFTSRLLELVELSELDYLY